MNNSKVPIFVVEKTTAIKFEVTINNPNVIVIYHDKYDLCYSAHPNEQIPDEAFINAKLEYNGCRTCLTMAIGDIVLEFNTEHQIQIPGVEYNHNLKQHQQRYNDVSPADIADEFLSLIRTNKIALDIVSKTKK